MPEADLADVLAGTPADSWRDLRKGRILVTGASGFIGTWLLESLSKANLEMQLGLRIRAICRRPHRLRILAPHLLDCKEIEFEALDAARLHFGRSAFSHIIHAASDTDGDSHRRHPISCFDSIFHGTEKVLEFASSCGAPKVLFLSSGAVYGPQPRDLSSFPEDFHGTPKLLDPLAAYGNAKRAAEALCGLYWSERRLPVKIARLFAFIGPRIPLARRLAAGNFIRDGLRRIPITVTGSGASMRTYLHAADMTAHLLAVLTNGVPARPYNVGGRQSISIRRLAETIASRFNVPVKFQRGAGLRSATNRYVPSVDRIRDELGVAQRISLATSVARTVSWYSAVPKRILRMGG